MWHILWIAPTFNPNNNPDQKTQQSFANTLVSETTGTPPIVHVSMSRQVIARSDTPLIVIFQTRLTDAHHFWIWTIF